MNAVLNEVKFSVESSWLSKDKKKRVNSEECRSWLWKFMPKFFNSGRNDIVKVSVDEERHLIYTLARRDYVHSEGIAPSTIDIYYLGAFGEAFRKVNAITQLELSAEYKKNKNSIANTPLQIVGLHHIPITESDNVHLMIVTSTAQRIYISLKVKEYNTNKMKEFENGDYYSYHKEIPTGEWKINGITNPPMPKDISHFTSNGLTCCTEIGFDHSEL